MPGENVQVAVRVRPFNQREKDANSKCVIRMEGGATTITNPHNGEEKTFTFDHSYWSHDGFIERNDTVLVPENDSSKYADQQMVFSQLGRQVLDNAWEGYNSTLFAYGQTGSGKSYSMLGYGANKGIVPIACGELFKAIDAEDKSKGKQMQVTFSMLEIYNENVRDLLVKNSKSSSGGLKVRQDRNQAFYVPDLRQLPCQNYKAIERLMEEGTINRTTASTNMNATSSRSHMVITIKFKQVFNNDRGESTTKTSEINLVDLAGSERAKSTGATGDRLKEGSSINRSLLNLGSVIEALADGNPKRAVPYRGSVLTKLLKSALGGNSKTVMIAALSPADINYEETLSTLRYADRAKKIQNKAVINMSPTEKLIHDLKAENARLLQLLAQQGTGASINDKANLEQLIAQNERQMKETMMSWEQKLEEARREWELEHVAASDTTFSNFPYFQNVNEDPQLSGVIKKCILEGVTIIGRCSNVDQSKKSCIPLRGLGIQEHHLNVVCTKNKIYVEPILSNEFYINGIKTTSKAVLKHGDRLKMGSNSLFLYIGFPNERKKESAVELTKKYDYSYFQNELAASLGINYELKAKHKENGQISFVDVYNDYITLMPMVAEVNAMSKEMKKSVTCSLFVLNLASHDSVGMEKEKEVAVKVVQDNTDQVWIWSKAKFTNRKYLIEELFQKYDDDPKIIDNLNQEDDPFWDPVEDVYLGCAHAWLHSLAYRMPLEDQIAILNDSGKEEGHMQVTIAPCSMAGVMQGDEVMILDPNELLGNRFDMMIHIQQCVGLQWIKQNSTRGIQIKFKFFNEKFGHQTRAVWHVVNPRVNFQRQITIDAVNHEFLNYMHSNAVVMELWGLQSGRPSGAASAMQDNGIIRSSGSYSQINVSPPSTATSLSSTDWDVLEKELEQAKNEIKSLKDEKEELIELCRILKKENSNLKIKAKDLKKGKNGVLPNKNGQLANGWADMGLQNGYDHKTNNSRPSTVNQGSNIQAELGRALKRYFGDIKPVQSRLQEILETDLPPEPYQSKRGSIKVDSYNDLRLFAGTRQREIEELSSSFNRAITSLKDSVAATVRSRKNEKIANGS